MTDADRLSDLPTPQLILDEARMLRNIARLRSRLRPHEVTLCPHLKTAKSVEVARRVLADGTGPATVSTLKEAEVFAAAGIRDILYTVGIAPQSRRRSSRASSPSGRAAAISPSSWTRASRPRPSPRRPGRPTIPSRS